MFQALKTKHTQRFDKTALFAFNFSYVGSFAGASAAQRRPALWAHWYVRDRLAKQQKWDFGSVDANDIERFIFDDPRYKAQSARKVATNMAHLYKIGHMDEMRTEKVERWWVDSVFLAMDRLIEDRLLSRVQTSEAQHASILEASGFMDITGRRSLEKDLAIKHVLRLYAACGARQRFRKRQLKPARS